MFETNQIISVNISNFESILVYLYGKGFFWGQHYTVLERRHFSEKNEAYIHLNKSHCIAFSHVVGFEIRDNKDIKDITKEVLRNLKFERILK